MHSIDKSVTISIADKDGTIIYVNEKFCKLSKYDYSELVGHNHRILKSGFHPDSFYEDMWSTISSGETWTGVIKNKAKDDSFYWINTTIATILNSEKNQSDTSLLGQISHNKRNLKRTYLLH